MQDQDKAKEQLIEELAELRSQVAELTALEVRLLGAEKTLKENQQQSQVRYKALFQNVSDGVAIYKAVNDGEDFVIVQFNRAAEKITGVSGSEVIGKKVCDVFPGVKDMGLFDRFQAVWRSGEPTRHPVSKYEDSTIQIWVDNYVSKLPSGEIIVVFRDVTTQKAAEEASRKSTEILKILVESLPVGILYVDASERIVFANSTFASWWGKPGTDLSGHTVEDILGDYYAVIKSRLKNVLAGQETAYEGQVKYKDGITRDIVASYVPHLGDDGQMTDFACLIEDVTHLKLVERKLRENEQRLQLALEGGNLGLWDWNLETGRAVLGERTIRMIGYDRDQLDPQVRTWKRIVHSDDWERVSAALNGHLSGGLPFFEAQFRMQTRSGELKWFEARGRVVEYDKKGKPIRITGTILDVTERKRSEEALHESEIVHRTLCENIPGIVYRVILNEPIGIQFLNTMVLPITGFTESELKLGEVCSIEPLIVQEDKSEVVAIVKQALADDKPFDLEYRIRHKDGGIKYVREHGRPIKSFSKEHVYIDGIIFDDTERKRLEEEKGNLIIDLQNALSEVKKLSGFLPICSTCKKIRDDKGYWNEVERYIGQHSEAEFSHSICPDCMRKLYPEYADEVLLGLEKDEKK